MTSFAEDFGKAVVRWLLRQPEVLLEFSVQRPQIQEAFRGMVVDIEGTKVTFRKQGTDQELPIEFSDAIIRLHDFSQLDAVCSFVARWENASTFESMECVLTELRVFGTTAN
jgi:hypothetical protein